MSEIFEMQKALSRFSGVSGCEESGYLKELTKDLCDEQWYDPMGSLICHVKGPGKKLMMCAHMDVIGIFVRSIDDRGFLMIDRVGGLMAWMLLSKPVRFKNGTVGIIRPIAQSDIFTKPAGDISFSDIFIDIGAASREEALKLVSPGDTAIVDYPAVELKNGLIATPYADDLCSCIALVEAMKKIKDPVNDLYFVFSVQEEVGCRGAGIAAANIRPDFGLAIDVNAASDNPDADKNDCMLKLGAGVGIGRRSATEVGTPGFIAILEDLCRENGIPTQISAFTKGGTDAGSIQRAGTGAAIVSIGIATRYIHSSGEVYSEKDITSVAEMLTALSRRAL